MLPTNNLQIQQLKKNPFFYPKSIENHPPYQIPISNSSKSIATKINRMPPLRERKQETWSASYRNDHFTLASIALGLSWASYTSPLDTPPSPTAEYPPRVARSMRSSLERGELGRVGLARSESSNYSFYFLLILHIMNCLREKKGPILKRKSQECIN